MYRGLPNNILCCLSRLLTSLAQEQQKKKKDINNKMKGKHSPYFVQWGKNVAKACGLKKLRNL